MNCPLFIICLPLDLVVDQLKPKIIKKNRASDSFDCHGSQRMELTQSDITDGSTSETFMPVFPHEVNKNHFISHFVFITVYSIDSDTNQMCIDVMEPQSSRGKKCSVSVEKLHSKLNQYAMKIMIDGTLVKPSESRIYQKISSHFQNYSAQSVYQAAKRFFARKYKLETKPRPESDDFIHSFDRFKMKPKQYTKFHVSINDLQLFRDEKGVLKSTEDWAPLFKKIAFAISLMPCAWSIGRPRMAGNEITVNGHCLQQNCDAKLFAYTENDHAKLIIHATPSKKSVIHEKKYQIRGEERKDILNMLKTDMAKVVVAKIANECLRVGDIEPPFMPKDSTVRKIKSGRYDHLTFDSDPMISLREMKYTEPYQNSIGNIGMDPFDCSFCTPYQKELIRIETNRKRIVISYDATGIPVEAPKTSSYSLKHGRFKPIFLYVIMLLGKPGENMPVYQFLSQRQDATNIRFSLDTWRQKYLENKHPDEVITDAGPAVVLAGVKAFARCSSVEEYADKCYGALFRGKSKPFAYIRLDRAHTVHTLLGMLKGLDRNKKRLYSRILGLLLLCEDINEAKVIIENMFIVLLNRFQYNDHVIRAIKVLKEITDTHVIPPEILTDETMVVDNGTCVDDEANVLKKIQKNEKTLFYSWIKGLTDDINMYEVNSALNQSIEEPTPDMQENPFYAPELESDLVVFLSKIHLWSNVMLKCFGSNNKTPTSASSEGNFNLLKNVVFPNEKRIRVDVFIRRYIDYLDGSSLKSIVNTNTNRMALRSKTENTHTALKPVSRKRRHSKIDLTGNNPIQDEILKKSDKFASENKKG